jgi:hypothetical protein
VRFTASGRRSLWESREQAERVDAERLRPAIEAVMGGPPPGEPETSVYEAQRVITR